MNKYLCPLPWKEIAISTSGSVRVCCTSISGKNLSRFSNGKTAKAWDSLEAGWNTDLFRNLRSQMLEGKASPVCSPCYEREDNGLRSPRNDWLDFYPDWNPESTKTTLSDVRQMDLRLSNKCNLACRMCNPYSSSAWSKEWPELPHVDQPTPQEWLKLDSDWSENDNLWEQLKKILPNLRTLYLSGGEPLLNPLNKKILEYCVQERIAPQLTIRYNTNGTIWDSSVEELWRHFKKISIKFSIDGLGALNDYIRHPSRFDKVIKNLQKAVEASSYSPLDVSINCTVQVYNVFQLPDFYAYFKSMDVPVHFDIVQHPRFLKLQTLPPLQAEHVRSLIQNSGISDLMSYLPLLDSSNTPDWNHFLDFTRKLDSMRGQQARNVLPEYYF